MRTRPLFVRKCGETTPHTSHVYVKRWRLVDLPLLPQPERYPAEWDSRYSCPGLKLPGKTWHESLGLAIPANAPGGQRIAGALPGPRRSRQNANQIDYEGFYDTDAHRGSDQ